ncbi:hypothetical protein PR048_027733 [Dryococelus australis]|uniref:Uncharacterized protein n=1 Tax=Dryococelus australis TaxID=614101 RepID=A0ABQ9GHA7_9NEOP|nr:hypothetical protein PR048_027733 [Dryococelus australis]
MRNFQEMLRVICDCEAVMNSMPITNMPEDPCDLVALTPTMFLQDIKEIGSWFLDKMGLPGLGDEGRHLVWSQNLFSGCIRLREYVEKCLPVMKL